MSERMVLDGESNDMFFLVEFMHFPAIFRYQVDILAIGELGIWRNGIWRNGNWRNGKTPS
jgi:hypothetical protein